MISVIIPLYNKEPIIEQSLQSVLFQDYDDFEVIVVNDGSTDKSVEIVKSIKDPRITLIEQKNGGPSKARNTGVRHAKGEWILFLDADDELLPGALKYFHYIINKHKDADIVDCNRYNRIGKTLQMGYHPITGYIKYPMKEFFLRKIAPGCGQSIYKISFLLKHPYNEQIRRFEDAEVLIRQLDNAKVYSTSHPTMIHNLDYTEASRPRKNVYEDYFAYLDFNTKGFWRKMCIYRNYIEERNLYPDFAYKHYKNMYYRYDLLILYKTLNKIKNLL